MSVKLPKYLLLRRVGTETIQGAVNEAAERGYKLKEYFTNFDWEPAGKHDSGLIWYASMELDTGNYDNVTNLKDVPSEEVDSYLVHGWEIASASISTKFVRMIKRRETKCLS